MPTTDSRSLKKSCMRAKWVWFKWDVSLSFWVYSYYKGINCDLKKGIENVSSKKVHQDLSVFPLRIQMLF